MTNAERINDGSFNLKGCAITNWITISCIIFAYIIIIPICIYFFYPLFKQRKDIILKKRHLNLSILAIVLLIIQLITENVNALADFDVIYANKHGKHTVRYVRFTFASIFRWAAASFIFITFSRFFLIYFDINYNILIANDEWKSIINQNHIKSKKESNFFIKYKSSLGSKMWWMRLIIIDSILALIGSLILAWYALLYLS